MDGCVCKEEEEEKGWREGGRERGDGGKDGWRKRRQERGRRDGRKILHATFTLDAGTTLLRQLQLHQYTI